mmetsp:Transcript_32039/g.102064  ORF Transcript_32039/g.102064 Transcript_32039/m.102064 type:complete len:383 (-) Transcript_32039:1796-2944(-)
MPSEESGQLRPDQVALALENLGHLLGDEGTDHGPAGGTSSPTRTSRAGSAAIRGRTRVDSSARPPEFINLAREKAKHKKGKDSNDLRRLIAHGINEPTLRKRIESKAVDQATVDRVRSDFEPHDKLTEEELANLDALVEKAHAMHTSRDDKGAERIYSQVLEKDPVNYECLTNLAKISYSRGDLEKASELFERAIVVRPQHDKTVYHLAIVLYDMRNYERSKALFEEVVHGYNEESEWEKCDKSTYHNCIAMLGLIHQNVLNDFEKARILYSTVLKSDPEHILTLDHKCSLLVKTDEREEAAKLHKHICDLDPNHTKKACPYLDSLFPNTSDLFHDCIPLEAQIQQVESTFQLGAKKKSWTNHPWRSLKKKISRSLGRAPQK